MAEFCTARPTNFDLCELRDSLMARKASKSKSKANQANKIDSMFKKAWNYQMNERTKNLKIPKAESADTMRSKNEKNSTRKITEIRANESPSFMINVHPFAFVFTIAIASMVMIAS